MHLEARGREYLRKAGNGRYGARVSKLERMRSLGKIKLGMLYKDHSPEWARSGFFCLGNPILSAFGVHLFHARVGGRHAAPGDSGEE